LTARGGEVPDDGSVSRSLRGQELAVELLAGQRVEIGMADILGCDATFAIPRLLEGKRAVDVIDPAAHLLDAPAGPPPELRRDEVDDGNPQAVRPLGELEVEPRIVDEHDGGRAADPEMLLGLVEQAHELPEIAQDPGDPDHREVAQGVEQLTPGGGHSFAAKAGHVQVRDEIAERADEVAAVQIAARFA